MSRALAVFHGHFGRATVYQLNRPFNVHAHREGHLIFRIGGTPGCVEVLEQPNLLCEDTVVAVNPWEPHNFLPKDLANGALFLVLYVNAEWFAGVRGLREPRVRHRRLLQDRQGPARRRPVRRRPGDQRVQLRKGLQRGRRAQREIPQWRFQGLWQRRLGHPEGDGRRLQRISLRQCDAGRRSQEQSLRSCVLAPQRRSW